MENNNKKKSLKGGEKPFLLITAVIVSTNMHRMKISSTKNPQVPCAGVSYVLTEGQERHFGWSLRGEMKEIAVPSSTHCVTLQRSICDCEEKTTTDFWKLK